MYKLRELDKKDIQIISKWTSALELNALLGVPFICLDSIIDEKWFERYINSKSSSARYAIVTETCDDVLGVVSLTNINFVIQTAKIHLVVAPDEKQGEYASIYAINAVLYHAFNNMNLHRIELDILEDDVIEQRLYEEIGFKKEGLKREAILKDGKFKNMVSYSILKSEFKNQKSNCNMLPFYFECCVSPYQKEYVIRYCDDAFGEFSILKREDYKDILEKIFKFATVIYSYSEELTGYVAMYINNLESREAYITLFAVKTKYQKRHVGMALMTYCCDIAKECGMKTIALEVRKDNYKAISFYKKNGFKTFAESDHNSLYMRKILMGGS